MKFSINTYKAVAVASFLVLLIVQFFLVFNTYKLENEHYYFAEKNSINYLYGNSIRNDKVFPGGSLIIDHYINTNMAVMEHLSKTDAVFNIYKQKLCDSIFTELRAKNNIDSVMEYIFTRSKINKHFKYRSTIQLIDVAFRNNQYVSLYNKDKFYPLIDSSIQKRDGILIAGNLPFSNEQNKIASITVSSSGDYTYRITFSLHGEPANRQLDILRLMFPTFLLSLFSVVVVVCLYFITFRNWLKQKKLSEMKSDFINSITHEFHTPLAAIIVANKTMQNEKIIADKESLLPLTEVVKRQAERLKILISQVLDITTMNQVTLNKKEYQLDHLLDEILLDYRLKLMDTNIQFVLQKNAAKGIVELDQFWFTTVLLNIFDNAIKYNDKEFKRITVTTYNDKKTVLINIADNGNGMTPEIQKHIFEKFYRDNKNVNLIKGLGLGLFYVKQAIDAHNWTIEIESKPGEGSVFRICMNSK